MIQYKYLLATSIATAVLALSAIGPAEAGARGTSANAAGRCQAALPSFEGALRKRPLALQNEGTSSAFVTCSFVTDDTEFSTPQSFELYARSVNGTALTLNCTAVVGYDTSSDITYLAKSASLTADGAQSFISWGGTTDFPDGIPTLTPVSVSCAVPAGAALNDFYLFFNDGYADPTPSVTSR